MTDADNPHDPEAPATAVDAGAPCVPAASDPFCEIVDEDEIYPNHHEHRIPDCGAPWPQGLNDPIAHELIDTVRWFLSLLTSTFWSPASLARLEHVWQWRKFDFLDWLRPIELLLRRLLLIEALGLILSQALPPLRPIRTGGRAGKKPASVSRSKPAFDADYPETWRVSFTCVPAPASAGSRRPRRRLPPVNPFHIRGEPRWRLRSRRVLHNAVPLALRLEAVIRVTLDPGKYARRLAQRLQRSRNPNASLLVIPRRRPFPRPAPRETLAVAGERAAALHHDWWSSA